MTKRGPIIFVGIVCLALLVTPFAIGMVNENAMRREVDTMPAQAIFDASIESFDRGWFNSIVHMNLGLSHQYLSTVLATGDPTLMALADFRLPIVVEIGHGPVLLQDGFGFGTAAVRAYVDPESELATMAEVILGMPYVLELRGRGGFGSGFTYEGEIPGADFALPDVSLSWTSFEFAGAIGRDATSFEGMLTNVSLQSPFAGAIVESLALSGATTRTRPDRLPTGTSDFSIGRVTINDPLVGGIPLFSLEGGAFSASIEETDGGSMARWKMDSRLASLSIGNDLDISDSAFGVTVNDIDAEAAYQLSQLSSAITASADPDLLLEQMLPLLDRILAGAPSVDIDPFAFSMPEGEFTGTARVALDPSAFPTGSALDLQDEFVALTALSADIDLRASKALAQRLAGLIMADQLPVTGPDGRPLPPEQLQAIVLAQSNLMLGMLAGQGIVIDEGDAYTTVLRFENGQMLANGQPLGFGF